MPRTGYPSSTASAAKKPRPVIVITNSDIMSLTRQHNQASGADSLEQGPYPPIQQKIAVSFDYPVHFTDRLFDPANPLLAKALEARSDAPGFSRRALCFIDAEVNKAHPDLSRQIEAYFSNHLPDITLVSAAQVIPGGELCKQDPGIYQAVCDRIVDARLCRHCFVIAVGGGALIDMVGYAAATVHRGIPLVRIPTTVLSQNDSALSVKNAVNSRGMKNLMGTFAPPHSVFCDFSLLVSLPRQHWIGGVSEAIKVALLRDADFFAYMEDHVLLLRQRDLDVMRHIVYRCAQLHLEHISTGGDPLERGTSRPLDFGHWAAHKLEALTDYALHHGEAVAVGLALDTTYAWQIGLLSAPEWERVINLLTETGLPVFHPALVEALNSPGDNRCILQGLEEFREHLGGRLTIMLLRSIGCGHEVHEMDPAVIRRSIHILEGFQPA